MYSVLAFYRFTSIEDPHAEIAAQQAFLQERDAASRIYISEEGINGQLSAKKEDAEAYMKWMRSRAPFEGLHFKMDRWHENVFPRLTVKYRKQLVAIDRKLDIKKGGEHLSPEKWRKMLEGEQSPLLLDVRNDYETKVGHFKNAILPRCRTFREFNAYAERLKKEAPSLETPVMMYCTGGIRCELYSVLLKEKGFKKVYQLEGGVINYGQKEGGRHWLGKLFVFDDRLTVPISGEKSATVGKCRHCGTGSESYYNCANMDCNALFLCCADCLKTCAGCCGASCRGAKRLRPYHEQNPHKPFRKAYHYRDAGG